MTARPDRFTPVYRSTDDMANDPAFREFAKKEFPGFANIFESLGEAEVKDFSFTRRQFLAFSAAGLALAGGVGCRRPDLKILPYSRQQESVTPGMPTFYATTLPRPGGGFPVVVESAEGRPTKIEGNPVSAISQGATDLHAQAETLDMYAPHRIRAVSRDGRDSSWEAFDGWAKGEFAALKKDGGAGLAFLVEDCSSPTLRTVRDAMLKDFPKATWHVYESCGDVNSREGTRQAFGEASLVTVDYSKAMRVVSLDCDFLGPVDPQSVANSKGFAKLRQGVIAHMESHAAGDKAKAKSTGKMPGHEEGHDHELSKDLNRLYVVESNYTVTGSMADHRLRLPSTHVADYAIALAKAIVGGDVKLPDGVKKSFADAKASGVEIPAEWISAVAKDLIEFKGQSAVVVGPNQPPVVQLAAAAINSALGNYGDVIAVRPLAKDDARKTLADLVPNLKSTRTLVMIGGNPVYSAPADYQLAEKLKAVKNVVRLGLFPDESSEAANWVLPMSHSLETWGDLEAADGTLLSVQPLIAPLFDSRSLLELLILWGNYNGPQTPISVRDTNAAFVAVKATFAARFGKDDAQGDAFRKFLHEGFLADSGRKPKNPTLVAGAASDLSKYSPAKPVGEDNFEVVFVPDNSLLDGRYVHNGWMMELPDPITKLVWDNAALISPATAKKLGVEHNGNHLAIEVGGTTLEVPAYILPGHANNSVTLPLGYGTVRVPHTPEGGGVDVSPLRRSDGMNFAPAKVTKTANHTSLVTTQEHGAIADGRDEIVVDYSLEQFEELQHHYLEMAAHGEKPHTPLDESAEGKGTRQEDEKPHAEGEHHKIGLAQEKFKENYQAGYLIALPMALDGTKRFEPIPNDTPPGNPTNEDRIVRRRHLKEGEELAYPEYLDGNHQWGMVVDLNTCTGCSACVIACQAENNIPIVGKPEVRRNREMYWMRIDRYFAAVKGTIGLHKETPDIQDEPTIVSQPMMCQHCEGAPCETVCPVNAAVHSPEGLNLQVYNRCIGTRYCSNNCPYKVRRFNWFDFNQRQLDKLRVPTFPRRGQRLDRRGRFAFAQGRP